MINICSDGGHLFMFLSWKMYHIILMYFNIVKSTLMYKTPKNIDSIFGIVIFHCRLAFTVGWLSWNQPTVGFMKASANINEFEDIIKSSNCVQLGDRNHSLYLVGVIKMFLWNNILSLLTAVICSYLKTTENIF